MDTDKTVKRPHRGKALRRTPLTGYETLSILEAALLAHENHAAASRAEAPNSVRRKPPAPQRKVR